MKRFAIAALALALPVLAWAQTTTSAPAGIDIVLPEKCSFVTHFEVSRALDMAIIKPVEFAPRQAPKVYMIDLKTGKASNFIDKLPDAKGKTSFNVSRLSPDQTKAMVEMGPLTTSGPAKELASAAYVVDLKTFRTSQLPRGFATWLDDKRVILSQSNVDNKEPRGLGPLIIYNIYDGTTTQTQRAVMFLSASAGAQKFIALTNPEKPLLMRNEDGDKFKWVVLDRDLNIVKEIAGAREMGSMPMISPSGRYVAYVAMEARPTDQKTGLPTKSSFRVVDLVGKDNKKIEISGMPRPVGVTDDGRVLALGAEPKSRIMLLVLYEKDDKKQEIGNACTAKVVGDTIYYINGDHLKSMPLPKASSK